METNVLIIKNERVLKDSSLKTLMWMLEKSEVVLPIII